MIVQVLHVDTIESGNSYGTGCRFQLYAGQLIDSYYFEDSRLIDGCFPSPYHMFVISTVGSLPLHNRS